MLTVVGLATSVTNSAAGWVTPGEIARLRRTGRAAQRADAVPVPQRGTAADIRADTAAVGRALPPGSVAGTESYLSVKASETSRIGPFVPFLVAFGVIGLVMSVLIVANVVSGAVVSGYRRIGILKSIGFTPGQVVAAYTGQVTVPAVVGCAGRRGARQPAGAAAAAPGRPTPTGSARWACRSGWTWPCRWPCWPGRARRPGCPSTRAGRLSAVQAIAAGRAPRQGRGYAAHRLLGRLRLPRPVTIGLAAPFARPARTAITLVAVLLGATAVTFAVGLSTSLNRVVGGLSHATAEPVQVCANSQQRVQVHRRPSSAPSQAALRGPAGHAALRRPRPTTPSAWPG